jgi:hypothetical protein
MTIDATITNRQENVFGDKRVVICDVALGVYAAAGANFTPAMIGMRKFDLVLVSPAGGYSYTWNSSTQKIMAFRAPAGTSTGVITAPISVTMGNITLTGPAGTGAALFISNDTVSGTLGKEAATDRATADGGFGIPIPSAVIAPTFVGGTSTQAVMPEVTGTPTLSTTARVLVIGD